MSMGAPLIHILKVAAFERMMPFVRPFRFGAVTVTSAPQAFLRVEIEVEGQGRATGVAAEMMIPKWFDKNPAKSPAETVADLRTSLVRAAGAYAGQAGADTAFGHHCSIMAGQSAWAESRDLPALTANFGPALVDKAILDALLKSLGLGFADGIHRNAAGLDTRLTPDLDSAEIEDFLLNIQPSPALRSGTPWAFSTIWRGRMVSRRKSGGRPYTISRSRSAAMSQRISTASAR